MPRLALFAIAIDDVRDFFRADDALAERLRSIAAARLARSAPKRRGFFRPLLTRDPQFAVDPSAPSRHDIDAMLAGGYIEPDRLPQCWSVLATWLDELSASSVAIPWDEDLIDRVEWNLATSGLNSDYSLRRLAERPLGVPLHPLPEQVVGYAKHVHVVETSQELAAALGNPETGHEAAALAVPVLEVLRVAASDGLDIVAVGQLLNHQD